jgi:hypothetical protein
LEGLNLLGASTGLADQYITLRVTDIDKDRLREKAGGLAAATLPLLDVAPKAALDAARPFIESAAKGYGVGVEVTVSNVPPSKGGRAISEFWPGLFVGGALGAGALVIAKLVGALVARVRR